MDSNDDTPSSARRIPMPVSNPLSRATNSFDTSSKSINLSGPHLQNAPLPAQWASREIPLARHRRAVQQAPEGFVPMHSLLPAAYTKADDSQDFLAKTPAPNYDGAVKASEDDHSTAEFTHPVCSQRSLKFVVTNISLLSASGFYCRGGKNITVLLAFLSAKQATQFVSAELHASLVFEQHGISIEFLVLHNCLSDSAAWKCSAGLASIDRILVFIFRITVGR